MPKTITQYNVFIGSPGGLSEERESFRDALNKCSRLHASEKDVRFEPIGWEDTIGGAGRPQELINEDLRQCDYALFVFHDRWGTETGSGYTSGTEEEWALAEELYTANKIRNIALLFKKVDDGKLKDPGDQLKAVLAFKKKIETEKRYFFAQFDDVKDFIDKVDGYLAKWLKAHSQNDATLSLEIPERTSSDISKNIEKPPKSSYWIAEADFNIKTHKAFGDALFCSKKALEASENELEWAKAKNIEGIAQFGLEKLDDAISAFAEISQKFIRSPDLERRKWAAKAIFNKATALGAMGRINEAIATYNEVIDRFGMAAEPELREPVAKAIFNKGVRLATLDRSQEAIVAYDEVVNRFGDADEPVIREQVVKALLNKGDRLSALDLSEDAIAAYDEIIDRLGTDTEPTLKSLFKRAKLAKKRELKR